MQVTGDVRPGEKIVALGRIFCTKARLCDLLNNAMLPMREQNHERKTLQSVRAGGARALDHPVLIILITIAGIYSFWP